MKGSECVFDYFQLLYYKCDKINPNRGGLDKKQKSNNKLD